MDKGRGRNITDEELQKTRLLHHEEQLFATGELPTASMRSDLKIEACPTPQAVSPPSGSKRNGNWRRRFIWLGVCLGFFAAVGLGFFLSSQYTAYREAKVNQQLHNQAELAQAQQRLNQQRRQLEAQQRQLEQESQRLAQAHSLCEQAKTQSDNPLQQLIDKVTGVQAQRDNQKQSELAQLQTKIGQAQAQLDQIKTQLGQLDAAQQKLLQVQRRLQQTYQDNKGLLDTLQMQLEILFNKLTH